MMRVCRECGDDDCADDDLCDFCTEVFNSTCTHLVYDICASCDADMASADATRETLDDGGADAC